MTVKTLCIVGAGTMGTGIAQLGAQAGLRTVLCDPHAEARERSAKLLNKTLQGGVDRGKLTAEEAAGVKERLTWESGYDRLAEADWVIEAVFEDLAIKREVLGLIGELAPAATPVASNTSTFVIHELAACYARPQYFLGMHFFNPPPAMKLVEVVPGRETLPEVTAAALELCERMGRSPKVAPDIPGFVVNRAYTALLAAAIDVWVLGGDPEAIDASLEMGLGHKMGPLRTADLIGLDICLALLQSLHRQTGHPRFEAHERFVQMVAEGRLGVKSGEGFYSYA